MQPWDHATPFHKAAYANGRIYIADRTDVLDPPVPPAAGSSTSTSDIYNPRPAIYWAWLQPTFAAYGPCACYWNFNWCEGGRNQGRTGA